MDDNAQMLLYGPRDGKSIKRIYQEIENSEVFKGLSDAEIYFSWLIGIPFSPVDHELDKSERMKVAAVNAFPKNEIKRKAYEQERFSDQVKKAIMWFESKRPEARLKLLSMQKKILENYETIVNQELPESIDEQKKYTDTVTKINESLPDILKTIEEAYGLSEKSRTSETGFGSRMIDLYMSDKQRNT